VKEKVAQYILTDEERVAVETVIVRPLATLNAQAAAMALVFRVQHGMSPAAGFNADFTAIEEPKAKE